MRIENFLENRQISKYHCHDHRSKVFVEQQLFSICFMHNGLGKHTLYPGTKLKNNLLHSVISLRHMCAVIDAAYWSLWWSVCLCVCWSQPWAVLKRKNRSRCLLVCGLEWDHARCCSFVVCIIGREKVRPVIRRQHCPHCSTSSPQKYICEMKKMPFWLFWIGRNMAVAWLFAAFIQRYAEDSTQWTPVPFSSL